jgi:hypothetical protein
MKRMSKKLLAALTATIVMTACGPSSPSPQTQVAQSKQPQQLRPPDPPKSEVLDFLEKNGAGDMSKSSLPAFRRWFGKRTALAEQVAKLCLPIEQHATVSWGDSTEARTCTAAHETSALVAALARRSKAWTFVPPVADKRGW